MQPFKYRPRINSGDLRHKITIEKLVTTTSPSGFEEESWQSWKEVWAAKNNLSGKEFYSAKAVNEEKTVTFKVRYFPEVEEMDTTKYRIAHDSKTYNITFIDNFMYLNESITFKTMEVNPNG